MSILTRVEGGVTILEIHGNITLGPSARAVQAKARRLLADPACSGIVINLKNVKIVDSAGIGGLVTIHSSAARRKVPLIFACAGPRLVEIFEVTRVDGLFDLAETEQDALRKFPA